MNKKSLLIILVILLLFFSTNKALADELTLPSSSINPNNPLLYSFKRLFENTILLIKFNNESKAAYYRELVLVRMAELQNVTEHQYLSEVQQSTQRISFQVGVLADFIVANRTDLAKTIPATSKLLNNYKKILVNLRDKYPANTSFRMLVQHSINSIDLNLDKLK